MVRTSIFAVAFALLLLTTPATTSVSAAFHDSRHSPGDGPRERGTTSTQPIAAQNDTDVGINDTEDLHLPNLTDPRLGPRHRLALANYTLHGLEADSNRAQRAIDQATGSLDTSIAHYRANRATDRRAFHSESRTLQALARAAGGSNDDTLLNVSTGVFMASNDTARLAIQDANRSLAEFSEQLDDNGRRYVERALNNAADGIERGEEAAQEPNGGNARHATRRQIQAYGNAIDHHRSAYHHANRGMDRIERAVEPELSLSQGMAVEHNGTVLVGLRVGISDVRPTAYQTAIVRDESGSEIDRIGLQTHPTAARTVGGTTAIDVGSDLENRTIQVESTAAHDASRSVSGTIEITVDETDVLWEPPAEDEFNQVTVENESSGVRVRAGGEGLWGPDLRVTDETPENDSAPRVGPVVRIRNYSTVESATVTVPITEDVSPEENVSIYTWDPTTSSGWERVETTVDRRNDTATATVDHFSFFSVFLDEEWDDFMTERIVLEERHYAGDDEISENPAADHTDVVFVVDESGSMSGTPIRYARLAAQRFVASLFDDEEAGLVGYSSGATLRHALTGDHDSLNASISGLSAGGGTDTEAGIRRAITELETNDNEDRPNLIVLLSDGHSNSNSHPREAAETAADSGIEISTVGLGSGIDEAELRDIANITGGGFYHVQNAEDLPDTFERVAENRTDRQLRDTSGDGIPDAVAEANPRMVVPFEVSPQRINIDPALADTSGDGLLDNQTIDVEYRIFEEGNETILETRVTGAVAHPARYDTDGDGLSDHEELDVWGTSPWLSDSSFDGFNDYVDPNPRERNTLPRIEYQNTWGDDVITVEAYSTGAAAEDRVTLAIQYRYDGEEWQDLDRGDTPYMGGEFIEHNGYSVTMLHPRRGGISTDFADDLRFTAIDGDGNVALLQVDVDNGEPMISGASLNYLPAAAAAGSRVATTSSGFSLSTAASAGVVGVVVVGAGVYTYSALTSESFGGVGEGESAVTITQPVPPTETVETWEAPGGEGEIRLPSGDSFDHETVDGVERGWGWQHLQELELPGIDSPDDVGEVIEDGERHPGRGPYDLIIGDNPNGGRGRHLDVERFAVRKGRRVAGRTGTLTGLFARCAGTTDRPVPPSRLPSSQQSTSTRSRGRGDRLKRWVLMDANRWAVAGLVLAIVFVGLAVLVAIDPVPLEAALVDSDPVETLFQGLLTAIVTGVTLVVTINQVVLSQELGPAGDQRERIEGALAFRDRVAEHLDVPVSPPEPSAFLSALLEVSADRARELRDAAADCPDAEARAAVESHAEELIANATVVAGQLEGAQFGTFDVLQVALGYNYSLKLYEAKRLQRTYGAEAPEGEQVLDPEAAAALTDLIELLEAFGPAREHVKTLYFQWSLVDLSRAMLYSAVPALVVTIGAILTLGDGGTVAGSTLGVANGSWVVVLAATIALAPFALLVAFVLRIATVAQQTLAIGPFVLRETARPDDEGAD